MTAAGPRALREAVHCAVRRAGTVDSRLPSSQDCPIAGISRGARPASGRRVPREPPVMSLGFVHLHIHSAYSLLEGALPIARLAELAKADRQAAVALTDTNNMFGALEFSDKMAGAGIQPIIGCTLSVDCGDQDHQVRPGGLGAVTQSLPRLVLLAVTDAGYRNLLRLNSRA